MSAIAHAMVRRSRLSGRPTRLRNRATLRVRRFSTLGFEHERFEIHVHDLPDYGVDGLVGINFLKNYNFTVRPRDQQIHLEPVSADKGAEVA